MTTLFFGCLRCGEVCLDNDNSFDSTKHLCNEDVTLDKQNKMFKLYLKTSKTDKFSNGVTVYIGCSKVKTCAFCLMKKYLKARLNKNPKSPLFQLNGRPLKKSYLISVMKLGLAFLGYTPTGYTGHSFRAGSASSASIKEFKEWELKLLGRWESSVYNIYLRKPSVVASFAKKLVH